MSEQSIDVAEADIRAAESRFKRSARFLLDFNIGSTTKAFLSERGWDVESAGSSLTWGCSDKELFEYAHRSERIILTCDKNCISDEYFPPKSIPGLIVLQSTSNHTTVLPNVLRTLAVMAALSGSFQGAKVLVKRDGRILRFHKEPETDTISTVRLTSLSALEHGSKFDTLLAMWDKLSEHGLQSHEKGRRLEEFTSAFFSDVFNVVESRLNTENGELDLILEVRQMNPFWMMFGSDALVECKNWKDPRPLSEAATFCYKANQARDIKLGFIVSVSGFTNDAIGTLRNNARDSNNPLIVPITGVEIVQLLNEGGTLEEFLKGKVRSMRMHAKVQ